MLIPLAINTGTSSDRITAQNSTLLSTSLPGMLFKYAEDTHNSVGQWPPILGDPDVLELQFPEAITTSCASWGFWELQSKNIWVTQGWGTTAINNKKSHNEGATTK